MYPQIICLIVLICSVTICSGQSPPPYGVVSYPSAERTFEGYLFKPEGKGPFPAMIFNTGYGKPLKEAGKVSEYFDLARIFVNDGYVFFVPDRHLRFVETNEFSPKLRRMLQENGNADEIEQQKFVEINDANARDVAAAIHWLRKQPFVDAKKVVVSGWSSGGMATLNASALVPDIPAIVLFSPGVTQWHVGRSKPFLRQGLERFTNAVFVVQSSNDPSTEPSDIAREVLGKTKVPHQVTVYPHSANANAQSTSIAIAGWQRWGYDVMVFLENVLAGKAETLKR